MTVRLDRRTFLAATCAGCVGLVAACGSDPQAAAPSSTGAAPPSPAGASTAPAPAAPAAAGLVALADIPVGEATDATAPDGTKVLITRTGESTAVAFTAKCTHQGCTVAAAGGSLDCPCHGSQFDAATGAVIAGPAQSPLASYPVRVTDGQVVPA